MSYEKRQVLYDLRVAYEGPFVIEDFFDEVQKWAAKKGFTLEHKKKLENITKTGKELEWTIEIHHPINAETVSIVRLRVLIEKLRDVVIERKGKKMHLNNGDVLVNIDGFVHSIYSNYWSKKPVYMFFRTIVDQYIYNFFQDKEDGIPVADAHDLYKAIKAFFHLQNYKYE